MGSFRDECLNLHWFESLAEARREIEVWRRDYNESRPHMALNDLTPGEFARQFRVRPKAEGDLNVEHLLRHLSRKAKRFSLNAHWITSVTDAREQID